MISSFNLKSAAVLTTLTMVTACVLTHPPTQKAAAVTASAGTIMVLVTHRRTVAAATHPWQPECAIQWLSLACDSLSLRLLLARAAADYCCHCQWHGYHKVL